MTRENIRIIQTTEVENVDIHALYFGGNVIYSGYFPAEGGKTATVTQVIRITLEDTP